MVRCFRLSVLARADSLRFNFKFYFWHQPCVANVWRYLDALLQVPVDVLPWFYELDSFRWLRAIRGERLRFLWELRMLSLCLWRQEVNLTVELLHVSRFYFTSKIDGWSS